MTARGTEGEEAREGRGEGKKRKGNVFGCDKTSCPANLPTKERDFGRMSPSITENCSFISDI